MDTYIVQEWANVMSWETEIVILCGFYMKLLFPPEKKEVAYIWSSIR